MKILRKHPIKRPHMLTEACSGGRGFAVGIEILIFLLVFFIAQLLQMIPVGIATVAAFLTSNNASAMIAALQNGNLEGYQTAFTRFLAEQNGTLMLVQLFSTALSIATAILFCRLIEKRTPASMGLRRGNILGEYLVGSVIGIAMISLCVGLCAALGGLTLQVSSFPIHIWLLYVVGFLIQGMSEELLCRGYLMVSISRKNKLWLAIVWNAVLFALLHIANPGIGPLPLINIAFFGIFESVYVLKRGNIWGAGAIHSLWNFFQGNVYGISVSGTGTGASPLSASLTGGMEWLNGGTFGLEGGIAVTAVLAVAVLLAIFVMPNNAREMSVADF